MSVTLEDVCAALRRNADEAKHFILNLPEDQQIQLATAALAAFPGGKISFDDSTRDNSNVLALCFNNINVSAAIFTPSFLERLLTLLDSTDFGLNSQDAAVLKAINNGTLPHESIVSALVSSGGVFHVLRLMLSEPIVHPEVSLMCARFLHRMVGMHTTARLQFYADIPLFCQICDAVVASLKRVGDAASEPVLNSAKEMLKCLYAIVLTSWPTDEIRASAVKQAVVAMGTLISTFSEALTPVEDGIVEQIVPLLLLADETCLRTLDESVVKRFICHLIAKMHAHVAGGEPAEPLRLVAALQLACRMAALPDWAPQIELLTALAPPSQDRVPPHVHACLQSFSDDVKTTAEELAWLLAGENPAQLIGSIGIGYSAGILHRKGLLEIPE